MKRKISLALLSLILVSNISCNNDKDEKDSETTGTLTVEEGKQQLEDNSIEILNKIEDFKNDNALNEIIELAEFLTSASTSKSTGFKKTALNTVSNVASVKNTDLILFNAKQSIVLITDTPLADAFEEETGIYQWNAETSEFDKTDESDKIIYNIDYNSKVAVFTITDFITTTTGSSNTEVPTLAKANLKINDNTVFTQNFTTSFQNDQLIPSSINNTTTIGDFVMSTSYTNTDNKSITQTFEFKISDTIITSFNYSTNGNFNNEDGNIEDTVDNVAISFQFLNANLDITAKDDNFNSDIELSVDQKVDLLNSNTTGELSINNKSIAKSEFYKDQDTYTDYVYNSNTQQYEEVEVNEDIVNIRFMFEDGTTNDFDTYIEGSFTELEDKYNAVFDAYETLFKDVN